MTYRVELDIYNGPLDLLLYLIRKEEVEIANIPIMRVTEQYLAYVDLMQSMDINIAGDFLVMAATLMEIKSRMLLPRPELEADPGEAPEDEEDPRQELVRQLLEYKRFKEAAQDLETLSGEQARRYGRPAAELVAGPEEQRYALDQMMQSVELWDLLNAFARVMRSINIAPTEVVYDDTPIERIAEQIADVMADRKTMLFSDLFLGLFQGQEQIGRSHVISALLAILECIRQRLLAIQQDQEFSDLRLFWREGSESLDALDQALIGSGPTVSSRQEARQAKDFDHHEGRLKEDLLPEDAQKTEFDDELDAISVPDVERFKPIYSEDELMGRKGEEPTDGQAGPPSAADSPVLDGPPSPAADNPAAAQADGSAEQQPEPGLPQDDDSGKT
jgi:segregation and condensation protein A